MRATTKKQMFKNRALEKKLKPIRISGLEKKEDNCEWCKKVKMTALYSIWSKIDPVGNIIRLCEDCVSCCAG